jgi:two-component system sensor histidine kinase/response regulator
MSRILVIDDVPEVREVIVNVLEAGGHEGIAAPDAMTALELIRERVPDLIICDIMMPKMDGYELLEKLRSEPETMIVPFIFLTAKSDKTDQRRGMLLGADDYITKPFSVHELLKAVEVRLAKHEALGRAFRKEMDGQQVRLSGTLPLELRTPLSGILTTSKVLLDLRESLNSDQVFEIVGVIHGVAERLYHLVENYVLFSELAVIASKPHILEALRRQCTDAGKPIVAQTAMECAERVGRGDDLILRLCDSGVQISDVYLAKIVAELTENALKFSLPGTPVMLRTQCQDGVVVLSVTDEGRGMTAGQITKVDSQRQLNSGGYEQNGAALGLVIVRELARLYQGKLSIESKPGEQTTVRVTLPVSSGTGASQAGGPITTKTQDTPRKLQIDSGERG